MLKPQLHGKISAEVSLISKTRARLYFALSKYSGNLFQRGFNDLSLWKRNMKFAFVEACPDLMILGGFAKLQALFDQIQRPQHSDLLSLLKGSGIREWEGRCLAPSPGRVVSAPSLSLLALARSPHTPH